MVPSLFQEAIYSDLVYSRVLPFFETSTCSHPFFERYWVNSQFQLQLSTRWVDEWVFFYYKRVIAITHSFKSNAFLQNTNFSKEISDTKSVIWQHHFYSSIFSMIVTGALEAIHISGTLCLFHNTCLCHPL